MLIQHEQIKKKTDRDRYYQETLDPFPPVAKNLGPLGNKALSSWTIARDYREINVALKKCQYFLTWLCLKRVLARMG